MRLQVRIVILTIAERSRLADGTLNDLDRARIRRRLRALPLLELAEAIIGRALAARVSVLEVLTCAT